LLLEIASIIHGQGLSVVEAVIRGGSESPITPDMVSDAAAIPDPPSGRRVMRFWLKKGRRGQKLVRVVTVGHREGGGGVQQQHGSRSSSSHKRYTFRLKSGTLLALAVRAARDTIWFQQRQWEMVCVWRKGSQMQSAILIPTKEICFWLKKHRRGQQLDSIANWRGG
jgi:hypothetical protein